MIWRTGPLPTDERALDLLAARATIGIDEAEAAELSRRLAEDSVPDRAVLDAFAAELDLATLSDADDDVPPMPAGLHDRLMALGQEHVASRTGTAPSAPMPTVMVEPTAAATVTPRRSSAPESTGVAGSILPWLGWVAAAAVVAFAFLQNPTRDGANTAGPMSLEDFVTVATDLIEVPVNDGGVTGTVYWSTTRQAGFLQVNGLAANDPTDRQYQLWIVDGERDARSEPHPAVDGGVFDVPAGADSITIPIDAKIQVFKPAAFAITSEPPGGVVKHDPELDPDRFQMLAVAAVQE